MNLKNQLNFFLLLKTAAVTVGLSLSIVATASCGSDENTPNELIADNNPAPQPVSNDDAEDTAPTIEEKIVPPEACLITMPVSDLTGMSLTCGEFDLLNVAQCTASQDAAPDTPATEEIVVSDQSCLLQNSLSGSTPVLELLDMTLMCSDWVAGNRDCQLTRNCTDYSLLTFETCSSDIGQTYCIQEETAGIIDCSNKSFMCAIAEGGQLFNCEADFCIVGQTILTGCVSGQICEVEPDLEAQPICPIPIILPIIEDSE